MFQYVLKGGCYRLSLLCLLLVSVDVHAIEPTFGTLEFDGKTYQVQNSLRESPSKLSPFSKSSERPQLNFGWIDLQPAFATKRFQCRNPERPLKCLGNETVKLSPCSEYENLEGNFVKLSQMKSDYGDTPEERGIPSAWSKLTGVEKAGVVAIGSVGAVGAAVGVGAALIVVSPIFAISAIMRPECTGWNTKWVEFDHKEFNEKIRAGLVVNGYETAESRISIESRFRQFAKLRDELVKSEESRLKNELNQMFDRARPYEILVNLGPRIASNFSLQQPTRVIDTWNPPSSYTDILPDYDELAQMTSQNIVEHFKGQRELKMAAMNAYLENVMKVAEETTKARFANADSSSRMESLMSDLQRLADPADLMSQASARLKVLQQLEKTQQELAEKRRIEEAKKEDLRMREDARKASIALSGFRKSLKVGMDTNCGPVIEIRPPMVKIASAVKDYGTEHWIKISTVFPSGSGCRFFNGEYIPPQ